MLLVSNHLLRRKHWPNSWGFVFCNSEWCLRIVSGSIYLFVYIFLFTLFVSFYCNWFLCSSFSANLSPILGGAVASWLVRSTPERVVRVGALAGNIVLCSWARHFTLMVLPLSTQVYKWVPANCWGNLAKSRGSDLRWTSIPSRGSRNTSSRFMLQKPR